MTNNKNETNKSGGWSVATLEACLSDCLAQLQAVKASAHPFRAEMAQNLQTQIETLKGLLRGFTHFQN